MKNLITTILSLILTLGLVSCQDKTSLETKRKAIPDKKMTASAHLYLQTNETNNAILHYSRNTDGTLNKVARVVTKGKGTNGFKATTGEASAPDPLLSANSVILSDDQKMLFAANSGDNSVSIFSVGENGLLTLMDNKKSGENLSLNSLAYHSGSRMLYALHSFGPNHISVLKVTKDMKLQPLEHRYTVLDAAPNGPSETCWVSIDADNKYAYAANFDFGTISSFEILKDGLRLKHDKMTKIKGVAGFKALAGIPTSGPADNWMSKDGFLYQIYGAAGILVAFKAEEGRLSEVGRYTIPLNSPQGITGL